MIESSCSNLMGVDVGVVRVGVAFSDGLGLAATPFDVFLRAQGRAEKKILQLIEEKNIKKVVVGMPLGQHGNRTPQCDVVDRFIMRLKKRTNIEIVCQDEYLSSEEAKELMIERGMSVRDNPIDAVAAMVILEDYMRQHA